jgi:hypothetical protein
LIIERKQNTTIFDNKWIILKKIYEAIEGNNNLHSEYLEQPLEGSFAESTAVNFQCEIIPVECSCFSYQSWNNFMKHLRLIFSNNSFKGSIGSGNKNSNKDDVCSMNKEAKRSKFETFVKECLNKFRSYQGYVYFEEEKNIHPPFVLLFLDANFITGFSVLIKKPELPQKFSTEEEQSSPNDIGTIFIVLQLHWSNGYCISPSSSDDG